MMKRIISFICAIALLLTAAVFPAYSAETPDEGADFRGRTVYLVQNTLEKMPLTVEAWVRFERIAAESSTILSNMYENGTNSFSFKVFDGVPSLYLGALYDVDAEKDYYEVIFEESRIAESDTWVHLAMTVDTKDMSACFYIDGELTEKKILIPPQAQAIESIEFSKESTTHRTSVGGRYSYANPAKEPFCGEIGYVAAYSDIRSADEIAKDIDNYKSPDKSGLLFAYLPDSAERLTYEDISGNGNHLSLKGYPLTEADGLSVPKDYNYSMIAIGDTQSLSNKTSPDAYFALFDWIAENVEAKKTEAVIGMGDMTNNNICEQWERVAEAFERLKGKVRHFPVLGNHDQAVTYGGDDPLLYDRYVKFEQTDDNGSYDKTMRAYYERFTVGEQKFLFLGLGYAPTKSELVWAKSIVKYHSDYNVILSTHAYLDGDGTPLQKDRAIELREELVMEHSNIVLVLCGHMHDNRPHLWTETRKDGSTVHALFSNPQDFNTDMSHGLATILYFSNGGRTVNVENYLPSMNAYLGEGSIPEFELDLLENRDPVSKPLLPEGLEDPLTAEGFSIRTRDHAGVRALFTLDAQAVASSGENGFSFKDYGFVSITEKVLNEKYDGDIAAAVKAAASGKKTDGVTFTSATKENRIVKIDKNGNKTFCGDLTDFPEGNYREKIYYVGFCSFVKDSKLVYVTDVYTSAEGQSAYSLYELTKFASDNGIVTEKDCDPICLGDVLK